MAAIHTKLGEESLRIAQVSPLYESVPPRLYGGTERVVSYLTEELVNQGHDVVLFASGDSKTSATLVPICKSSLRLDPRCVDPVAIHLIMMEEVLRYQNEFDIIHCHIDYFGFLLGRRTPVPVVNTLHGRCDLWEQTFLFPEFRECGLVSISNNQRRPAPDANWIETVYHGLPPDLYAPSATPENYLVYIGRISREKKVEAAIDIAIKAELPLKIAAKIDKMDQAYFEQEIKPLLDHPLIEFVGEVGDGEKKKLVASALAFLHPIDWPEPFGLSMIEAMACGTPVLARRRGAIPEVVDHGVTGFIFEENDEAVEYIKKSLSSFSRRGCRAHFEKRFLAQRMAGTICRCTGWYWPNVRQEHDMQTTIETAKDKFYISASATMIDPRRLTLKDEDLFGLFDRYGDIVPFGTNDTGLYYRGTRYLSAYELRMEGRRLLYLSGSVDEDNVAMSVDLTNPDLKLDDKLTLAKDSIHILRSRVLLQDTCFESISIRNFGGKGFRFRLELAVDADFRDIFEVRGLKRQKRGPAASIRKQAGRASIFLMKASTR